MSIAGSQDLQDQFELTKDQAAFGLNAFSITGTLISDKCPKGESCFVSSLNTDLHLLKEALVILSGRGEWLMDPATILTILCGEVRPISDQCYPHNHHHPCHCQPPTPPSSGSCCPSTVTECGRARSSLSRAPGYPPPDWSVIKTK